VVQRAGHHLLLGLHHAHELQQRVLQSQAKPYTKNQKENPESTKSPSAREKTQITRIY
jgi:hypothetical protein